MMTTDRSLKKSVVALTTRLRDRSDRLVLAESCTGGLLAALITEIPGASRVFCGSHVVYTEDAKRNWLDVPANTLKKFTAVSAPVAEAMVRGALRKTPEATIAGAITGYLGPDGRNVGLVYFAVLKRGSRKASVHKLQLTVRGGSPAAQRLKRRNQAASAWLEALIDVLESTKSGD